MATTLRKNQNRANPVLETRRQVMSAVITAYPGGRESAAARLGLPLKKLDNHLYENAGSQPLTDAQVHQLEAPLTWRITSAASTAACSCPCPNAAS